MDWSKAGALWPGSLPGSPVVLGALRDAIDDMTDPMPAGES